MTIVIVGTILLAFTYDAAGTVKLVATTMSVGGVTWIIKKVIRNINVDASQIIEFTGMSIAGISAVGILGNAIGSLNKVVNVVVVASDKAIQIAEFFSKFAEVADKITFWN